MAGIGIRKIMTHQNEDINSTDHIGVIDSQSDAPGLVQDPVTGSAKSFSTLPGMGGAGFFKLKQFATGNIVYVPLLQP